ncbi:hypothetical protein OHB33_00475 [Streptomyces sp. NBC_01558]|uniref:hypothetical protein n=1 Tax=unclassified Streptomyces TaxID=2593676 RepID=UPI00224F699B|nr:MULTISPECIES: hypothetical protein [unclassified Streptomyces]MCX5285623.1 hypothetical protein [Streptomyces sp. NBC_00198]WSD74905.1 hypothetical protein OHB33_00475 [Streptomyces sp. NBC_01558]
MNGLAVAEVVTEVGSRLNGRPRKLHGLCTDQQGAVIVVEGRGRLARFSVAHLEAMLLGSGGHLVILDPIGTIDDLEHDFIEVLDFMCAWVCGRRVEMNRANRPVAVVAGEAAE